MTKLDRLKQITPLNDAERAARDRTLALFTEATYQNDRRGPRLDLLQQRWQPLAVDRWRPTLSEWLKAVPHPHRGRVDADRETSLIASLTVLDSGVRSWSNGQPVIPQPLQSLIIEDGFPPYTFLGSIPAVAQEIADLQRTLQPYRALLADLLTDHPETWLTIKPDDPKLGVFEVLREDPAAYQVGDRVSALLADGRVLAGTVTGERQAAATK